MIELQVTNTVVDLSTAEAIRLEVLNTTGINIEVAAGQVVPAVELDVGVQGPQGVKGDKGDKGDKLEFSDLTPEQRIEIRGDVGDTSTNYTNLFNSVLLA